MNQALIDLRAQMKAKGIDVYLVPTADFHESEYAGEHFKARRFLTGFTGSNGTAVVTATEAGMWTDARYFLQAEAQMKGKDVTLYKMGEEGVPTLMEYLEKAFPQGGTLGFDGRVVNSVLGHQLQTLVEKKNGKLHVSEDLVGAVWSDRPPLSAEPVFLLGEEYTGKDANEKIAAVRAEMKEVDADVHLLTSLYDIAWLLNVRGNDIDYVPVVLSYLALEKENCYWFVQEKVLTEELKQYLASKNVIAKPYESFYDYAAGLRNCSVLLEKRVCNYRLTESLDASVKVIDRRNPTVLMKSIKNPVEMENVRKAHIKDATAVIQFLCWLKKNIGKIPMTEMSATEYLEARRAEQGWIEPSFDTICGYGPHAAIMHYAATPETDVALEPKGFLLVDSGGHYPEGSTDITRTIVLGPISDKMRQDYTRVLRSNLNLADTKFLYGCSGLNLDVIAREPLWEVGDDYKHGTGHGIGYVLNVHEGPNGFRWRQSPDRSEGAVLEEGMITSDEPGVYRDGEYGIRLESEILCRKGNKNEYGQFMYFENLTYVPMDLDAIDPKGLNESEKARLNAYHQMVYDTMEEYLDAETKAWLKEATRAI